MLQFAVYETEKEESKWFKVKQSAIVEYAVTLINITKELSSNNPAFRKLKRKGIHFQ